MHILWNSIRIMSFNARSERCASKWLSRAAGYPVTVDIRYFSCSAVYTILRNFLSAYKIKILRLPCYSQTYTIARVLDLLQRESISHLESLTLDSGGRLAGDTLPVLDNTRY